MKDVYYNIKGPYAIRMTIRNKVGILKGEKSDGS